MKEPFEDSEEVAQEAGEVGGRVFPLLSSLSYLLFGIRLRNFFRVKKNGSSYWYLFSWQLSKAAKKGYRHHLLENRETR